MIKNYNFKLINNLIYYRIIYSVLLSFFLVIISLNNAKANETVDPYVVKNIVVDITSTTTSNARDIALNKAQRIAYLKLIKRLVVADQINLVPKINDKKIIEMISSLQIDNKKKFPYENRC